MRFNIKKIAALGTSVLLTGMTMGLAAASAYPDGFSASNTAIVYGAGATLDVTPATSIQSSLGTSSGTVSVTGEAVALDRGSSSRIWLNTSLTTAQSIFTKTDLPTVLADSTFSGDVSSTINQQITLGAGSSAGGDNSGKVIFSAQPTSSSDPSVGVSIGTSSYPLYNASVTFQNAVNFTNSDSQGQSLTLFGRDYTVSSDTSAANGLVLFQSSQTVTLQQGGSSGSDSASVTIDGTAHTVTLLNAGTSSATISVDGTSQSVNVGSSRKINGVSIAITSVQSSTQGGNTAVVLVGANKLTFKDGQQVTEGDSNTAILGTKAYLTGGVTALTGLTVSVYEPSISEDWIGSGDTFADPVFGSFAISNSGLSSTLDDSTRDAIKVGTAGATTMTLSMTDKNGNDVIFDFAHNASGNWNLSTSNGYNIYPYEMANLSLNDYTLTGTGSNNQNVGRLLQLQNVYNTTGTSNDQVTFYDPITATTLTTGTPTAEGVAPLTIDGRQYTVYSNASTDGSGAWAEIKYPTTDSPSSSTFVLFPTLLAKGGESVALYAPQTLSLADFDGLQNNVSAFYLPNGNGYTSVSATYNGALTGTGQNWTIGTGLLYVNNATSPYSTSTVNVTVGQLTYEFKGGGSTSNQTTVYLVQPGSGPVLNEPAVIMFEGKDSNNAYHAVVVDTTHSPVGTSSSGVGVSGVYFTSSTHYDAGSGAGLQLFSNSNLQEYMDGFGTFVTKDSSSSSQPTATVSYPMQQVYEQLYLGAASASVGGSGSGAQMVTDSQASSLASGTKLIVVGGSCVNSVAASLLGVSAGTCGADWTAATGLGSGQFLIQSFASNSMTSGAALLVAGTDASDTVNAATYLVNMKPDVAAGKKYTGTSSTSASLVTSSA